MNVLQTKSDQEILTQFYDDMQEWIYDGCPEHTTFGSWRGICGNLNTWLEQHITDDNDIERILQKLANSFQSPIPFETSEFSYLTEYNIHRTRYKNPSRLDWIKSHTSAAQESKK